MNQQSFAQCTGISSASLSSIFTGRTNPSLKHVQLIMQKFPNVSPLWLLQGQGGMFQLSDNSPVASATENPQENSSSQNAMPNSVANGNSNDHQGNIFGSANMSAQPSLFDSAVATPSTPPHSSISQNGKRAISGISMNIPQQSIVLPTPQRKITEIRIFYDDQTWESFVPKNK